MAYFAFSITGAVVVAGGGAVVAGTPQMPGHVNGQYCWKVIKYLHPGKYWRDQTQFTKAQKKSEKNEPLIDQICLVFIFQSNAQGLLDYLSNIEKKQPVSLPEYNPRCCRSHCFSSWRNWIGHFAILYILKFSIHILYIFFIKMLLTLDDPNGRTEPMSAWPHMRWWESDEVTRTFCSIWINILEAPRSVGKRRKGSKIE